MSDTQIGIITRPWIKKIGDIPIYYVVVLIATGERCVVHLNALPLNKDFSFQAIEIKTIVPHTARYAACRLEVKTCRTREDLTPQIRKQFAEMTVLEAIKEANKDGFFHKYEYEYISEEESWKLVFGNRYSWNENEEYTVFVRYDMNELDVKDKLIQLLRESNT